MLILEGVSYRYAGAKQESLHGVSLRLREGTITGVVGQAEAGKTTLCLTAGGLAPRSIGGRLAGAVGVDRENIANWPMHRICEEVVVGLQDPAGQLSEVADTVFAEVAFGPANLGLPRDEVVSRAWQALEQVGAVDLAVRDPGRLSGGQQQQVVLAGLLAMRTRHLVLDEPLAHLDASATTKVLHAIRAAADAGAAVLVAEQRIDALAPACDEIAVMGVGNILALGSPEDVLTRPSLAPLGLESAEVRIRRLLEEAGSDASALDLAGGASA